MTLCIIGGAPLRTAPERFGGAPFTLIYGVNLRVEFCKSVENTRSAGRRSAPGHGAAVRHQRCGWLVSLALMRMVPQCGWLRSACSPPLPPASLFHIPHTIPRGAPHHSAEFPHPVCTPSRGAERGARRRWRCEARGTGRGRRAQPSRPAPWHIASKRAASHCCSHGTAAAAAPSQEPGSPVSQQRAPSDPPPARPRLRIQEI